MSKQKIQLSDHFDYSRLIRFATDNDARTQVLENIQDAMYEDGPFIVIAQAPAHIAHSSRLDGVDIFDSYTIDLTEINVK